MEMIDVIKVVLLVISILLAAFWGSEGKMGLFLMNLSCALMLTFSLTGERTLGVVFAGAAILSMMYVVWENGR